MSSDFQIQGGNEIYDVGVSQNRPMLFDLDGRERKLGLGIKKKNAPMGRGGVPPLSLVGAILSIF